MLIEQKLKIFFLFLLNKENWLRPVIACGTQDRNLQIMKRKKSTFHGGLLKTNKNLMKHKDKMEGQAREFLRKTNFDSEEAVRGGGWLLQQRS